MEETRTRIDLPDRKYRMRMHFCRKPTCQPCRQGTGHGPYWYVCERINGRVVQRYLGKTLPDEVWMQSEQPRSPFASLPKASEPDLRLHSLGAFRLEYWQGSWEPLTHALFPHARRLLGYLLSCSQRRAPRDQVVEALWPTHSPTDAALLLRKAVHTLATLLVATPHARLDAYFQIQDECLYLAGQDRLWVDADAFEALLAQAEQAQPDEQERHQQEAATLYQGAFFAEERHAPWAQTRRQTLHDAWSRLTCALAQRALSRGEVSEASASLQRLLVADPLYEPALERLMQILIAQDRRSDALRLCTRFAEQHQENGKQRAEALLACVQAAPPLELPALPAKKTMALLLPPLETPPIPPQQRRHFGPLVGRTRELEELRAILHHTPRPRLLCLTGEAGIGKTRLVEAWLSDAHQQGWNTIWSRSYAEEKRMPYRLWSGVLHTLQEQFSWPWQELARRPAVFRPLVALLPALRERLPEVEQSAQTPQQEERLLWEAVHELLIVLSAHRPLLLVLDDLHWADSGSSQLLIALLRHLHPTILLLATCRAQELQEHRLLSDALTEGQREGIVTMLPLRPLEEADTRTLIEQHIQLSSEQMQALAARSGGNPFFAEELARQAYHQAQQEETPAGNTAQSASSLPESIHAVLALRLSHLSAYCQRLLGKAAVLGHSFTLTVIAAMETQSGGVQQEALLDLLEEALRAGLLREEGTTSTILYQFWHPLLVSHLLGELSAARRARYHLQAVRALRQVYQGAREEEQAATIVHHLLEGGAEAQELAAAAERAGDDAYRLSVYPEAAYYYGLAVQQSSEQTPAEQRLSLLEHLGECQMIQGQYTQARQTYERALAVVDQQAVMKQGNQEDIQYQAQRQALLWSEIGWTWRYLGEPARAHECRCAGEQIVHRAGLSDGPAWASLKYQQGSLYWQEGRYQEALTAAQEALALLEQICAISQQTSVYTTTRPSTRIERTLVGDFVGLGRILTLLANICITVGKSTNAIASLRRALDIFEARHCLRDAAIVTGNLGEVYLRTAQHREAQAALQHSLEIAKRIGDIPVMCVDNGNLGLLAERLGVLDKAEVYVQQALEQAKFIGDAVYTSLWAAFLARILSKRHKWREAIRCLRTALAQGRDFSPCRMRALMTLSSMQVNYVMSTASDDQGSRLLKTACKTVQHVLQETGLEAELKVEGQLLLAQISALLQQNKAMQQIVEEALKEAEQYEYHWLVEQLQALMSNNKS